MEDFYTTVYDALRTPPGEAPRETILLLQSRAAGRRLLAALAAEKGLLLGVRAETPRSLALELCGGILSAAGKGTPRLMDDDEAATLLLECVLELDRQREQAAKDKSTFSGDSAGTLAAARELLRTLTELALEEVRPLAAGKKQADLQALREAYADRKAQSCLWDRADLIAHAVKAAEAQPKRRIVTLPALRFTALERRLIGQTAAGGAAETVPLPVPAGLPLPGADIPADWPAADPLKGRTAGDTRIENCMGTQVEVDFVFRDILEKGRPLDSCAVVYCSGSYAPLLYEAAGRWGAPVQMSSGIPFEQTRLSGALKLASELPRRFFDAELVRRLLTQYGCLQNARAYCDAGTLEAAGVRSAGAGHLAKTLRNYRVGWGKRNQYKQKYMEAIDAFRADLDNMDDRAQAEAYRLQSEIWRAWLEDLFLLTVGKGHRPEEERAAMLRFLDSASRATAAERSAVAAAMDAVRHVARIPTGERLLDWLRHLLFERGVLAENAGPGKLFCLPLRQGCLACRKHVYVLGLGHDVFSDAKESAVLLDRERAAVSPRLSRGPDAGAEKRFRFLQLLLYQTGEDGLILCYPGYDCERQTTLECARELETLKTLLGPAAERNHDYLSEAARTACDDLLGAQRSVAVPLPDPDPGDAAAMPLAEAPAFADWLAGMEFSPSAVETALRCPFKFYLTYALGIREVTLPAWRADRWLDAAVRGTVVHDVLDGYYKALRQDPGMARADREALAERLFRERWAQCLRANPPADDQTVEDNERTLQLEMVKASIAWTERQGRDVRETEQSFDGETVRLKLGSHDMKLGGKIDRLDLCADGTWAVLDYKTGDPETHKEEKAYHLQHYFYTEAERVLSGGGIRPGEAGYLLLGGLAKGEKEPVYLKADAADYAAAAAVTEQLLDAIADEKECLAAKPWVPVNGRLERLTPDEQLELLAGCESFCSFRELCPLRAGAAAAEDAEDDEDGTKDDGDQGKGDAKHDGADS